MPNSLRGVRERTYERVAHRGSPRERLENTLEGFLLALEHGADAIELDVHATADGEVIVHHDDEVHGHILAKVEWRDLARFDLGEGATIPRLADVLEAVGDRATVYIELKGVDIERPVIDVARAHGQDYALHSFDHAAIERVAGLAPDVPRGILLDRDIAAPHRQLAEAIARTRPRDVWPHWTLVDDALVQAIHDAGARVITWTVNSGRVARELVGLGVDGVCTDDVRLLDAPG
jgi:glycerophosphoryl diester phosphodiesterase